MSLYRNKPKASEVQSQNALLMDEYVTKQNVLQNAQLNTTKTQYQTEMYETIKHVNTYLLFLYYFGVILVHVILLEQYFRGIKPNHTVTIILFVLFFIYPAVIYYVEMYVYSAITYMLSFVYGSTYIYRFDQALLNTDFYLPPPEANASVENQLPSVSVHFT
jgi:hypothetical protein